MLTKIRPITLIYTQVRQAALTIGSQNTLHQFQETTNWALRRVGGVQRPIPIRLVQRHFSSKVIHSPSFLPKYELKFDFKTYTLNIPLKDGVEHTFFLREDDDIRALVGKVIREDPSIRHIDFLDRFGKRLSSSYPLYLLLGDSFMVRMDDRTCLIKPPIHSEFGFDRFSLHSEVAENPGIFLKIKKKFNDLHNDHIDRFPLSEYLAYTEDYGVDHETSMMYLHILHKMGVVFYFQDSMELGQCIIVNAKEIVMNLEKSLSTSEFESNMESLIQRIEEIRCQLSKLYPIYSMVNLKAWRSKNLLSGGILWGLILQWLIFARLTWWEFSWDVMEPVTYFVMTAELSIGAYIYYMLRGNEYSNADMFEVFYNWRYKSIAKRYGLSTDEWHSLNTELKNLEERLRVYQ